MKYTCKVCHHNVDEVEHAQEKYHLHPDIRHKFDDLKLCPTCFWGNLGYLE